MALHAVVIVSFLLHASSRAPVPLYSVAVFGCVLRGSKNVDFAGNSQKMPRVCSVEGCINGARRLLRGSGSVDPTVSFRVVPRDEPRRSQWLSALPMIKRQKSQRNRWCALCISRPRIMYIILPSESIVACPRGQSFLEQLFPQCRLHQIPYWCPCSSKLAAR